MSFTQDQLNDFAQLLATAMRTQAVAPRPPTMKDLGIAHPTPFTGLHKDYQNFRREVLAYIGADETGAVFTNDKKKITFVLSYMKEGTASTWAQSYYEGITDPNGVVTIIDTFTTFLTKLDASFKNPADKLRAYQRWQELKQRNTDAGVFFAQFEMLMGQADIPTTATNVIFPQLRMALHPSVSAGIIRLPTEPTSYQAYKTAAIRIDANERTIRQLQQPTVPQTRPPPPRPPPQQRLFDPNRGDYRDRSGITFGGQGQPMDIVMNRMRRENRCFECGEHGHFVRNCPKKKSRVAARAIVAELSDDLKEKIYIRTCTLKPISIKCSQWQH